MGKSRFHGAEGNVQQFGPHLVQSGTAPSAVRSPAATTLATKPSRATPTTCGTTSVLARCAG
jgi:hypothetical protein